MFVKFYDVTRHHWATYANVKMLKAICKFNLCLQTTKEQCYTLHNKKCTNCLHLLYIPLQNIKWQDISLMRSEYKVMILWTIMSIQSALLITTQTVVHLLQISLFYWQDILGAFPMNGVKMNPYTAELVHNHYEYSQGLPKRQALGMSSWGNWKMHL